MGYTVIAVDCGKAIVKMVVIRNGIVVYRGVFPSAMGDSTDGGNDMLDNLHTFTCQELLETANRILIGSSELKIKPDDSSSKDSLINKILTLFAIASQARPNEPINVVIGCPISIFKDRDARTQYLTNIVPAGEINCEIDGNPISFSIEKRLVCAESTGLLTLHPEYFRDQNQDAGIIDIGNLNDNLTAIHAGNIIVNSSHTSRHGGRMLQRKIKRILMDNDMDISDEQVLSAIQNGYVNYKDPKMKEKSRVLIEKTVESFIDDIENNLKNTWPNIKTLDLYFIGGTSYLLKKYLQERFKDQAHFENNYDSSVYTNAEGFAKKMYQMLIK